MTDPVPARVQGCGTFNVEQITDMIQTQQRNLLFQAPAGYGKSALLLDVVVPALEARSACNLCCVCCDVACLCFSCLCCAGLSCAVFVLCCMVMCYHVIVVPLCCGVLTCAVMLCETDEYAVMFAN